MKIAFISTYPDRELKVQCGVATYTQDLAQALVAKGHRVEVFAELTPNAVGYSSVTQDNVVVHRLWRRDAADDSQRSYGGILQLLPKANFDIIHVQHEFGLHPRNLSFLRFLSMIPHNGHRSVQVTYHTVIDSPRHTAFYNDTKEFSRAIFHTHEQLTASGIKGAVIPHGLHIRKMATQNERETFKVSYAKVPLNARLVLVPGFLASSKGHEEVVDELVIARDGRRTYTVFLGSGQPEYVETLVQSLAWRAIDNNISFHNQYADDVTRDTWFRMADYILLGTISSVYSASGQLATAVGYGHAILAKSSPIYRSQGDAGIVYWEGMRANIDLPSDLHCKIEKFAGQGAESVLEVLRAKSRIIREKHSWDKIADEHIRVYSA